MEPHSEFITIGTRNLYVHRWKPTTNFQEPRAVVVVYHGFLVHGLFPTVRFAAEHLASAGYLVVACDLPGHGQSPGLRGYVKSPDDLIDCGVSIAQYVSLKYDNKKMFLLGSSLGGAMAISVAHRLHGTSEQVAGVVMLAPLLKLSISTTERYLLYGLASVVSTWEIIPSSATSSEKQYRDPIKRQECDNDELVQKGGKIRVGSCSTCVELASNIKDIFPSISCPFLIMVADEDVLVDNQGALDLFDQASSTDKGVKRYAALHGLLCERSPLVDEIQRDMLDWVDRHTT